jgi:quercetin dioxygenase-like cupin family protein
VRILSNLANEANAITEFDSHHAAALRLAEGEGEARAYLVHFEAGGVIGRHEASYGQLFIVLSGSGWVSGEDHQRVEVAAGDVVFFERGEHHSKGAGTSVMTAVMVQVRDLMVLPVE